MSHHEFPYPSAYITVRGYRMHYIDWGSRDWPVVEMVHGNYSWSYTYRNFIPYLVSAGWRSLAPDLVGFGRSEKPPKVSTYTLDFHTSTLDAFVQGLGLRRLRGQGPGSPSTQCPA